MPWRIKKKMDQEFQLSVCNYLVFHDNHDIKIKLSQTGHFKKGGSFKFHLKPEKNHMHFYTHTKKGFFRMVNSQKD